VQPDRMRGYGLALLAACLWATIGLFYTGLEGYGLSRLTIVFYRAAITAVILFLVLGWRRRSWLSLARRDWPLFLAFGLTGVAAFFVVYIYAISLIGMGMAAVLMYTAPAWVTILSVVLFKEQLTGLKIAAVLLACGGCALVGQAYDLARMRPNLSGILAGLGAGLTYGLYTLFSKVAQRHYTAWTTLAYALGLGSLFMLPLQSSADLARAMTTPSTLFWLLLLGLVPTLGGGMAFNAALRRIPASNASIVATMEPAVATLLGWLFLNERLEPLQLVGTGLILLAVVVIQLESRASPLDPQ
jgi:DME family drug/metabolite transporter